MTPECIFTITNTVLFLFIRICGTTSYTSREADLLLPYKYHHGPIPHHRVVRAYQPSQNGTLTFEEFPAHRSSSIGVADPIVEHRSFVVGIGEYWPKYVSGHYIHASDPEKTVSVLEPLHAGGCAEDRRATVTDTAINNRCLVAVNAGFFNTTTGGCLGDIVSDGVFAHNSGGVQNSHFGIERDGSLFFGYIPPEVLIEESFRQLVGGVIWLVRNGENYIDTSKQVESSDSEETGSLETFIDIESARTAVGHDAQGKLVIVTVDGRSYERGVSLYEFADLLIELGVINAINLDGGGSSTVVVNGTLVNQPGDRCNISDFLYGCEREVSTVLCVHDITCDPPDCSNHGDCHRGKCYCHDNWVGIGCENLHCEGSNCSGHGICTEDGCDCVAGWQGPGCADTCPLRTYGRQCEQSCQCTHGELCDPVDGRCFCTAGYKGFQCDTACDYGFYGEGCLGVCDCPDGCGCHPVTGQCHHSPHTPSIWQLGHCVADKIIVRKDLLTVEPDQYFLLLASLLGALFLLVMSFSLNIVLLSCKYIKKSSHSSKSKPSPIKPRIYSPPTLMDSSPDNNNHSDADVDSDHSDSQPKSKTLLSKLPFIKNKQNHSTALWRKWKKKFRRKEKSRELNARLPSSVSSVTSLPVQESKLISIKHCDSLPTPVYTDQDLSPRVQYSASNATAEKSEHFDYDTVGNKQRNTSGHTEDLLDEISLELSSPERVPNSTSNHKQGGSVLGSITQALYGQTASDEVFTHDKETIF